MKKLPATALLVAFAFPAWAQTTISVDGQPVLGAENTYFLRIEVRNCQIGDDYTYGFEYPGGRFARSGAFNCGSNPYGTSLHFILREGEVGTLTIYLDAVGGSTVASTTVEVVASPILTIDPTEVESNDSEWVTLSLIAAGPDRLVTIRSTDCCGRYVEIARGGRTNGFGEFEVTTQIQASHFTGEKTWTAHYKEEDTYELGPSIASVKMNVVGSGEGGDPKPGSGGSGTGGGGGSGGGESGGGGGGGSGSGGGGRTPSRRRRKQPRSSSGESTAGPVTSQTGSGASPSEARRSASSPNNTPTPPPCYKPASKRLAGLRAESNHLDCTIWRNLSERGCGRSRRRRGCSGAGEAPARRGWAGRSTAGSAALQSGMAGRRPADVVSAFGLTERRSPPRGSALRGRAAGRLHFRSNRAGPPTGGAERGEAQRAHAFKRTNVNAFRDLKTCSP